MTTDKLIAYLRRMAKYGTVVTAKDKQAFEDAADRLEHLDERVSIMMEGNKIESERENP